MLIYMYIAHTQTHRHTDTDTHTHTDIYPKSIVLGSKDSHTYIVHMLQWFS